jgi:hypothetical protein
MNNPFRPAAQPSASAVVSATQIAQALSGAVEDSFISKGVFGNKNTIHETTHVSVQFSGCAFTITTSYSNGYYGFNYNHTWTGRLEAIDPNSIRTREHLTDVLGKDITPTPMTYELLFSSQNDARTFDHKGDTHGDLERANVIFATQNDPASLVGPLRSLVNRCQNAQ